MFRIEMLPAAHGDCLWLEYGQGAEVHRVLIDGGPAHTYPALRERILHLPADQRKFELLVVTHIDCDHIDGIVRLLQDAETLRCEFRRIWFNGYQQLNEVPDPVGTELGAVQGEYLSLLIQDYEQRTGESVLNRDFPTSYVAFDPAQAQLPVIPLEGGLELTLLSPDHERLIELKDRWEDELDEAKVKHGDARALRRMLEESRTLQPLGDVLGEEDEREEEGVEFPAADGSDDISDLDDVLGGEADPGSDGSRANGSSIALLATYGRDRFLLAGDAWPAVLASSIAKLRRGDRPLKLTGFKIPHHGSVGNLTAELLEQISCKHYMISTSGAIFRHPHSQAVDLLLTKHRHRAKPRLHFNYMTETTQAWSDAGDQKARRYVAAFPKGISLDTR